MAISIQHANLKLGHKTLLDDFSAHFDTGALTVILGPNGTGKSSLLKVLTQELHCDAALCFYGQPVNQWSKQELAKSVGILPQSSSLSFAFTVREVVELGGLSLSASQVQLSAIADEQMKLTEVLHLASRLYPSLSGGEKQRVHLARVLTQIAQSPRSKIVMLDEPTSALDIGHQHNTLKLAKTMAEQGAAVIAVLHDLNLAAQYADRVIMMDQGKIVADGTPAKALTEAKIAEVYQWRPTVSTHPVHGHPVIMA
ncbi:heme ABC transporter ATP-binding protein [Vibrio sp. SM6]|uniref:Heme ABC transporter ATP-binding protein n=1 Tax=Vibrio agarilyticus TaxID=2726741 RepID=A0A7X8TRD0_9VIBR|nr:heme ABC transporter ATP-binding protein [Vibrio agarilyticus]NLS13379.1 heme ABC transporter ATP-binding protein [Vibrio agarilyticus]